MKERVLTFGSNGNLVGIFCEPDAGRAIPNAPAAVLWNVGIHHRVGPYRIFVEMARALAEAGFKSLRFDISGLGDSEVTQGDARPEHERGKADVQTAMQTLRDRFNINTFILVAFCSGVDSAHPVALADARVVGMAYVEGYRFTTPGFYLRWPLRYLSRDRWERLIRLNASRWLPKLGPLAKLSDLDLGLNEPEQVYMRDLPTLDKLRRDIDNMIGENKRLYFIYSGGDTDYAYRNQFFDMLDRPGLRSKIEVDFLPAADHIWYLEEDRRQVIKRVADWAARHFSKDARPQELQSRTG